MRAFLLYISILWAVVIPAMALADNTKAAEMTSADESMPRRYRFNLDTPGGNLSGILILGVHHDRIDGSMVNEFGLSALDFTYNRTSRRVKLHNVIAFLNRWRVKYVLRRDLTALTEQLGGIDDMPRKNYEINLTGDTLRMVNKRTRLTYTITPLKQ